MQKGRAGRPPAKPFLPVRGLWLLPLALSIAVVYKATKVRAVRAASFIKESVLLFGSIVVFMFVIAVALLGIAWMVT